MTWPADWSNWFSLTTSLAQVKAEVECCWSRDHSAARIPFFRHYDLPPMANWWLRSSVLPLFRVAFGVFSIQSQSARRYKNVLQNIIWYGNMYCMHSQNFYQKYSVEQIQIACWTFIVYTQQITDLFTVRQEHLEVVGIRARTHIWVRETACLIRLTLH